MKELEQKYVDILEARNWSVSSYTDDVRVELEWYSPAGEDFVMCVLVENFPEAVAEYAADFDIDEHIAMWIEAKHNGVSGVPSARELVHDAEDIDKYLQELAAALMAADGIGDLHVAFEQLKEKGKIDVTNGIYIYYIDLKEYFNTGEKIVRCRAANDVERNLILSAGWIGEKEYENEFGQMSNEEKMDPDNYRGVRSKKILKNKLEILNGVKYVEDVMGKIMADDEMEMRGGGVYDDTDNIGGIGDSDGSEDSNGSNGSNNTMTPINIDELMDLRIQEVLKSEGKKIVPLNEEELEVLKKSDGLNAYAIERGEFWVNVVEKIKFLLLTPNILKMELIERLGELKSMPGAQEELNMFILDWIEDKATNVWGGFSQKFLNESATGSRDIVKDMMTFAGRYVDVKRVEKNYEWKEYQDEGGKIWKVRYSNNKMKFDEANLKNVIFDGGDGDGNGEDGNGEDGEDGEDGKRVILWNVPHKEELCTNCGELVEMARKIWSQKDWMPIEGYLGGIWDEDKKKEIGCVVLKLGEFGILILKKRWDTKI